MLNELKELSKLLIIPTAVLYFFGIICVNAYLARFGIVSFDIINSQFIIAGFYPLLSLAVVLYLAWQFYKRLPQEKFYNLKDWQNRVGAYFWVISATLSAALIINSLIQLGSYQAPAAEQRLVFGPVYGNGDYIGAYLEKFRVDITVSVNYILKTSIYVFSHLFILVLIIWVCISIYEKIFLLTYKKNQAPPIVNAEPQPLAKPYALLTKIIILAVDVMAASFYIAIAVYSYMKLHVELFDFISLTKPKSATLGLVFSWLFGSITLVYIFLHGFGIDPSKFKEDFPTKFTFEKVEHFARQLVLPILGSIFLFGYTIYPRIPFAIGGGEPRPVKVVMSNQKKAFDKQKLFLIGESSQFFFILTAKEKENGGSAIQLSKNMVSYIETKPIQRSGESKK